MNESNAIEIKNVSKSFKVKRASATGGTVDSRIHEVLTDISLNIAKSEVVGLIGQNGSGKSTLLKILAGIMEPDSGNVSWSGEVASILELGSGFDPNFTGRENIYSKCAQYGFSDKEIDSFIEEIIEFSGLGDEIDDPIRTYSSGMAAKLALPTILYLKRDIMIFDEILSVGDAGLGAKCNQIFRNLKNEGKTIIIASHNLDSLQKMCDRVIWIDDGKIKVAGKPAEVCSCYEISLIDSVDIVTRGAKAGDTLLQNRLGEMYRDGINVKKDLEQAEYWFNKASNLGFVRATMNLAGMMVIKNNIERAIELYQEAADAGDGEAHQFIYALKNGENKRLVSILEKNASSGNVSAMVALADCQFSGTGISLNRSQAFVWFKKAADCGDNYAAFQCGVILRDGFGVEKDISQSLSYLLQSANNNFIPACMELANMYRIGNGVKINVNEAIKWYSKLASTGNIQAMMQLGSIYRNGLGIDQDLLKSEYWYGMIAQSKIATKELQIANILLMNKDFHDIEDYLYCLNDAAEKGNLQAMYDLGKLYEDGKVVAPNPSIAINYFTSAANRGHVNSMVELSHMYQLGAGTSVDYGKAFYWMKCAADGGSYIACYLVGRMYHQGLGIEKNLESAILYYRKSAESGNWDAIMMLTNLSKENPN